ncbi:hypothetical protein [Sedimentibacter saalensis]|uniref:Uncharacterized protein n=1 Tax=Sedimentibacter saalensis TaxID=130788 RepID=A0A562J5H4_9FIRM|nr:hypothetical protein [Sedimentibacter saalensis]TWH78154.1 hypothetical protein LY60_02995 [Sedimentibacter saalensis]
MKKKQNISKKYRNWFDFIFPSRKINIMIASLLLFIITLLVILFLFNYNEDFPIFTAELLKSLSEFSMTVIFAIIALGISVFQSDNQLIGGDNNENRQELFIRYIFSIFPTIVMVILGFIVAILFEQSNFLIHIYSIIMILMMVKTITGIMKYFISFMNIKISIYPNLSNTEQISNVLKCKNMCHIL